MPASFAFRGWQLTPGMVEPTYTDEAQLYWGRWDQIEYAQAIVDADTVDSGNATTTQLRLGLAMGVIAATGQYTHWNPYATDGSNYLVGFFIDNIDMTNALGTSVEHLGAVMVKGNVKASQVVIPGEALRGIAGKTYEFLLREQCVGRFLFDDNIDNTSRMKEYTVTADLTATTAMNNTLFVLPTGAAASFTVTLPAPVPGLVFHGVNVNTTGGNALIFEGPATGEYWVGGATANSISIAGDTSILRTYRAVRITTGSPDTYAYVATAAS